MARLAISLLGGITVSLNGDRLSIFDSNKIRALLAYLAVESDRTHPRELLSDLFWPNLAQKSAQDCLRNALAGLRRTIGDRNTITPCLLTTRDSVRWNEEADICIDVHEIERAARQDGESAETIDLLKSAVLLYRGPFLAGFTISDSAGFEEWVTWKREKYSQLVMGILRRLADFYETCGEFKEALGNARQMAEIESWNEEAHRQIMRILAVSGQHSAALAQYESCKRFLADELGVDPSTETQRLYETIRLGCLDDIHLGELLPAPGRSPFKGMQFFDESDADLFFGRESLTNSLLDHIQAATCRARTGVDPTDPPREHAAPFLAITGASGSGKSSLLRAGLAPALRKKGWRVTLINPGATPRQTIDGLMVGVDGKVTGAGWVLMVDQFEELFTLCQIEEERQEFIRLLLDFSQRDTRHARGARVVVIALSADYYSQCARYPGLREVLSTDQVFIGPMTVEELRSAIEKPAQCNRWELEPGLVALFLQDIGISAVSQAEPGALPLLEHALLETWKRRRGRKLTLKGYAEAGGVRGAIAQTADAVYQNLIREEKELARRIFLRLTAFGEGGQDTRRRAELDEFRMESLATRKLLHMLADARLITLTDDSVEVAHEALIREWPALRAWLGEGREALRLHRHLSESAAAWVKGGREEAALYREVRLAQAVEWASQPDNAGALSALESEYLSQSRLYSEHQAAEDERRRQRELEVAYQLAETERQRAEEKNLAALRLHQEAQLAYAHELAALSRSKLSAEPDLSLLLAVQAVQVLEDVDLPVPWLVQQAVHDVALGSRLIWRYETPRQPWNVAFSPDGEEILFCDDAQNVHIWDAAGGQELAVIAACANHFCVTQKHLITTDGLHVEVWDRAARELLVTIPLAERGSAFSGRVAISPDGKYLAASDCDTQAALFDLSPWLDAGSPAGLIAFPIIQTYPFDATICRGLAFSPDGKLLFTVSTRKKECILWEIASGEKIHSFTGHTDLVVGAAFSPDNQFLATSSFDCTARVWNMSEAQATTTSRDWLRLTGHANWVNSVIYCPDGSRLATAGFDGRVIVWNAVDGSQLFELPTGGGAYGIDFHPDGTCLIVTTENGCVEMWDVTQAGRGELKMASATPNLIKCHASAPDCAVFLEISSDGIARIRNKSTLQVMQSIELDLDFRGSPHASLHPGGTLLAVCAGRRTGIWDFSTGQKIMDVTIEGEEDIEAFDPIFRPDGTLLAVAGPPGKIFVWNIHSQQIACILPNPIENPTGEFSPDGKKLAVGGSSNWRGSGGPVWVWQLDQNNVPITDPMIFYGDYRAVARLSFSPDSQFVASCGCDTHAEIHDALTGERSLVLQGHISRIDDIHYSPDGKYLVTTSWDGTARVWDAIRGVELLTYRFVVPGGINTAFFTADGRRVVVYGRDGVWHLLAFQDFRDLLAVIQSRKTRSWKPEEIEKYLHGEQPNSWV